MAFLSTGRYSGHQPTPRWPSTPTRPSTEQTLESYEDTLANLALKRDKPQEDLFAAQDEKNRRAREAYLLHYLLDVESRGSASLLDVRRFVDPSAYRLKVRNPTGDETRELCVDLLETFNWLLGLEVEYIAAPLHFDADFSRGEYGCHSAKVRRAEGGRWWLRTVTGRNRDGQQVLIVWRNLPSLAAAEADGLLRDNAVLDAVLIQRLKLHLTESPDDEFDLLYVNGDHNITIPRRRNGDPMPARLLLIEEAFHQLMFAEADA